MDNPYEVVPSPTNYAAPLVNMFSNPLQGQQNQNGQQQQPPPAQALGQGAGQGLAAVLKRLFGQNIPSQAPVAPGQPPRNIVPDAVDQYGMQKGPVTPTQNDNQPISNFNPNTTGSLY